MPSFPRSDHTKPSLALFITLLTPKDSIAVHVFWCIFEHPLSHVVLQFVVIWDGLESTPPQGENERIPRLQDFVVPSVFLHSHLWNIAIINNESSLVHYYKTINTF